MTVTILAVNGLESTLVERFDFANLKLTDRGTLSIPNDLPLHTEVLWPSIITGTMPSTHGLTRTNARAWGNPVLQLAAEFSLKLIPEEYLLPIGKRIQKLGFEREAKAGEEYFAARGIDTIFTGIDSNTIDVPGYSQWDDADQIRELMGHDSYEPDDPDAFLMKARERFDRKRDLLFDSLDQSTRLTMAYFQTLDNIQHVFWADEPMIEQWYQEFDELAGRLRDRMTNQHVLIIMSDHGMRGGENLKGEHSNHGYYAATESLGMDTIMDLKPTVVDLLRKEQVVSEGP